MIGFSRKSLNRGPVEAELSRQFLASERLCAGPLAIVMALLMLALILSSFNARIQGIVMPGMQWNILVFAGGIGYEVLAFFALKRFAMQDRSLPDAGTVSERVHRDEPSDAPDSSTLPRTVDRRSPEASAPRSARNTR